MNSLYQNNTLKFLIFFICATLQGCVVAGSVLVPLESIDPPKGKYDIGTQVYFWTDKSRGEVYTTDPTDLRNLMVQIWYPTEKREGYQNAPHVTFPKKAIGSIVRTAGLPTNFGQHGTRLESNSIFGLSPIQDKNLLPVSTCQNCKVDTLKEKIGKHLYTFLLSSIVPTL